MIERDGAARLLANAATELPDRHLGECSDAVPDPTGGIERGLGLPQSPHRAPDVVDLLGQWTKYPVVGVTARPVSPVT